MTASLLIPDAMLTDVSKIVRDAEARATTTRSGHYLPSETYLSALKSVIAEGMRRGTPLPVELKKLLQDAKAQCEMERESFKATIADADEIDEHLKYLARTLEVHTREGQTDDEDTTSDEGAEFEDEENEEEFEEDDLGGDDESDPDSEEDEDSNSAASSSEGTIHDVVNESWIERLRTEREIWSKEQTHRALPGYNRVVVLEAYACQLFGKAISAIRDILVARSMVDVRDDHVALVNGEPIEVNHEVYERLALDYDGADLDDLVEAIAAERKAANMGLPTGVDVAIVPRSTLLPPRVAGGPGWYYCPCCGDVTGKTHYCEMGDHIAERMVLQRNNFERVCVYESPGGQPLNASVFGRTKRGLILWVSPFLAARHFERKVRARYRYSTFTIEIDTKGFTVKETLPDPPTIGSKDNSGLLQVCSVRDVPSDAHHDFDHWWYRPIAKRDERHENETVIEYASATRYIGYKSVERKDATVLKDNYASGEIGTAMAAIIGDRFRSSFGPRVDRITSHGRKRPKTPDGYLNRLVRDGDQWKTLHLAVDAIDTFDQDALTAEVLEDMESYRRGRDASPIGTAIVRHFGAAGALRFALAAQDAEDDHDSLGDYEEKRWLDGLESAASYIATHVRHTITCPDCGVYEDCHDEPMPCGRKRCRSVTMPASRPASVRVTPPKEQLAFF